MWIALSACGEEPVVRVEAATRGLEVVSDAPVAGVQVLEPGGVPVTQRADLEPATRVELPLELAPGRYVVVVWTGGGRQEVPVEVAPAPPWTLEVLPSAGSGWVPAGAEVHVPIPGESARFGLAVVAGPGAPPSVAWSDGIGEGVLALGAPGVRSTVELALHAGETRIVHVDAAEVRVVGDAVDIPALEREVRLGELVFPADGTGAPQLGHAAGRVTLPSEQWLRLTRALGLGLRARDQWSPWAFAAVTFTNPTEHPVDLAVSLEVHDRGTPSPWFRPRLRAADGDTGMVRVLLRVPAHGASTAALPVFVDEAEVAPGAYEVQLQASVLGTSRVGWSSLTPLYVRSGSTLAGVGFLAGIGASAAGYAWVARRLAGWLERAATSELMTIALFGAVLFGVGSASDVLSMAVGAVLGPFSTLITGILQDVVRVALLGTLVTLLPRPGTLALATLTGAIGRAITTGGFSPTDILYTGASVALAEAFAWLAGLTRSGRWREEPPFARWARLSIAFAGANMLTTLLGLWLHIVLFRLYFADWYLWLQVGGPGCLYVLVACAVAVPFAQSLRSVES